MTSYDIVIVGGGPAGLAAAVSAKNNGIDRILILERDRELGGILNQCIHNGFGLHTFKEELTGPEYARRFINQALDLNIEYRLNTMVMDISLAEGSSDKIVTAMNRTDGLFHINAKTVILAMGCRERSRGALNIPGYRPAGIYSAGTAAPGEHRGLYAGTQGCDPRLRRHRPHHGTPYDLRGRRSQSRRRADALFRRSETKHCTVSGRFRYSVKAEPYCR